MKGPELIPKSKLIRSAAFEVASEGKAPKRVAALNTAGMAAGHQFDLPYSVELWDEGDTRVEELIALTGDYSVARAAYEEAIKRRPGRIVAQRQKTRVLADSRGGRHDSTLY